MTDPRTLHECGIFVDYLMQVIYSKLPRFMPIPKVPAGERDAIARRLASIIDGAIERKNSN